jgi:hypothetical protein
MEEYVHITQIPLPSKLNRSITPAWKKVVKSKIDYDLPVMVHDLVFLYKFQIIYLRGTYVLERKPNVRRTDNYTDMGKTYYKWLDKNVGF